MKGLFPMFPLPLCRHNALGSYIYSSDSPSAGQ